MADKDINAEMEVDAGNASFDDPGIGGLSYDDDDDNQPNAPSFNDIPNAPSSPINSHHENEVNVTASILLCLHVKTRIEFTTSLSS